MKNSADILNELRELAPKLSEMDKKESFTLPNGFFASFSDSVINGIRKQEVAAELQELGIELATLTKQNPFIVPANYFENLPNIVANQLPNVKTVKAKRSLLESLDTLLQPWIDLLFSPKSSFAFASIFSVCVIGFVFFMQTSNTNLSKLENISSEELNNYVHANADEFDEHTLAENVDVQEPMHFDHSQISTDELKNFLEQAD